MKRRKGLELKEYFIDPRHPRHPRQNFWTQATHEPQAHTIHAKVYD